MEQRLDALAGNGESGEWGEPGAKALIERDDFGALVDSAEVLNSQISASSSCINSLPAFINAEPASAPFAASFAHPITF